jgi:FMN phosphatase YigB (HAD superfamily)
VAPNAVFLVDVDNTLLDNDRFRDDVREHFAQQLGEATRDLYWEIQERLFVDLGYRDYLGALQQTWLASGRDMRVAALSSYLLDYPFAGRLYPGALDVLARFRDWGTTVALTDGESVFQPRKLELAGITAAVAGEVLIYVHKEDELDDVERRYPAERYVVVDDKLRILAAVKQAWGDRVTTVFPRQGQFANDAALVAELPPADVAVERIGELLEYDLERLLSPSSTTGRRPRA